MEKCRQITPWSNFTHMQAYDFSGIDEVSIDLNLNDGAPYEIYNFNGVKAGSNMNELAPGPYIIRHGKTIKKVMIK